MQKLALFTICLLSASTAFASKGNVTVTNHGNHKIGISSFDWDDGVHLTPTDNGIANPGESDTVTCIKGLFQPDTPGCRISIYDYQTGEELIGVSKKENGKWVLSGTWDTPPVVVDLGSKGDITNVNVSLDPYGGTEVKVVKGQLPLPAGGTSDCIQIGTEATLLDNEILHLKWQLDGNLVLYKNDGGGSVWASGTNPDATKMCFQGDGNLVIRRSSHGTWATGTNPGGTELRLQADCNLVIYDSGGKALWTAGTHGCP